MAKTPPTAEQIASWCAEHRRRATPLQRFAMRIDSDGQWWHEGVRISRDRLSALFAGVLARLDDGRYVLVTPAEWGVIEVEDVPYLITAMVVEMGAGEDEDNVQVIRFTASHGAEVVLEAVLDAGHVLMMREYRGGLCPYVMMRPGLEARINRAVYYQLAEYLTQNSEGRFGVWSAGVFHIMDVGGEVAGEV